MNYPPKAVLFREMSDFNRNTFRLFVRDSRGAVLMEDATWRMFEEGASSNDVGLILPMDALETIARAIEEFQGHTSHADTEAKVLREWLAVERARVDSALAG